LVFALAVVTLAGVLFVGMIFLVSEMGAEIVTLRTTEVDGGTSETRLWVVDDGGFAWLRSGVPTAGWLARIEAHPEVEVERAGTWQKFRAVPVRDPAVRDRIHGLVAEKYGFVDRIIGMMRDGNKSVMIRLEPVT
jgi:hypothetical protein